MSVIALRAHDDVDIPIGKTLVIDSTSLKPREFDSKVDTSADIIGVSYPKVNVLGRIAANVDGFEFYEKDYYLFTETLQYDLDEFESLIENPNYDGSFNPNTNADYVVLAIVGMCPVLKTATVPSHWRKIKSGTVYDLFLVK